jgi:hypothetical protein
MSASGQTRSFGDVGSMSGLPKSAHEWAIYEYTSELAARPGRDAMTAHDPSAPVRIVVMEGDGIEGVCS